MTSPFVRVMWGCFSLGKGGNYCRVGLPCGGKKKSPGLRNRGVIFYKRERVPRLGEGMGGTQGLFLYSAEKTKKRGVERRGSSVGGGGKQRGRGDYGGVVFLGSFGKVVRFLLLKKPKLQNRGYLGFLVLKRKRIQGGGKGPQPGEENPQNRPNGHYPSVALIFLKRGVLNSDTRGVSSQKFQGTVRKGSGAEMVICRPHQEKSETGAVGKGALPGGGDALKQGEKLVSF